METIVKLRQVGGSLVATIPKEIVDSAQIDKNDFVMLSVKKLAKSGFGSLKGKKINFTEDDRFDRQ